MAGKVRWIQFLAEVVTGDNRTLWRFPVVAGFIRSPTTRRYSGLLLTVTGREWAGAALLATLILGCGSSSVDSGEDGVTIEGFLTYQGQFDMIDDLTAAEIRFQEHLSTCMSLEGFDYFVDLSDQEESAIVIESFEPDASIFDAYVPSETGVYGVSEQAAIRAELADIDIDPNPNDLYLDSLSESSLEAYDLARFAAGGCEEEAADGSGINDIMVVNDQAAEIAATVFERLESEPEVLRAGQQWASCFNPQTGLGLYNPVDVLGHLEETMFEGRISAPDFEEYERQLASISDKCGANREYISLLDRVYATLLAEELARNGLN